MSTANMSKHWSNEALCWPFMWIALQWPSQHPVRLGLGVSSRKQVTQVRWRWLGWGHRATMAAERTQQVNHIASLPSKLPNGDPSSSLSRPLQQGDNPDSLPELVGLHLCRTHGFREWGSYFILSIKIPGRILTNSSFYSECCCFPHILPSQGSDGHRDDFKQHALAGLTHQSNWTVIIFPTC